MLESFTLSDYFSSIALLISAMSLFLSLRQYHLDRSALKTKLIWRMGERDFWLVLQLKNTGRRVVTVTDIKIKTNEATWRKFPLEEKVTLDEQDFREFRFPVSASALSIDDSDHIVQIEVIDATGKKYISKTKKAHEESI
jgi:P pilus assembly chaperone PapD